MFSVKVLYRKVVANLFILLVLKFHNHRTSSLGVMIFSSPVSESVPILDRFRKLHFLAKLKWEPVFSNYRRILVLFLSFPTNFGSPFFGDLKVMLWLFEMWCLNLFKSGQQCLFVLTDLDTHWITLRCL